MATKAHEAEIKALVEADDFTEAVALTLEVFGSELFGFLMVSLRDESAAEDVFQSFSLELWKALPIFRWQSSLRTWLYCLARGVVGKHLRDPYRKRATPLSTSEKDAIPERLLRTATNTWRKTEAKNRLWELCEGMPGEDRQLLLLRISQRMAWPEIAKVLDEGIEADDSAALRKAAAKLRKRFERIKNQLREEMTGT